MRNYASLPGKNIKEFVDNIKTIRVVKKCFKTDILKTCKCPCCCSATKLCPTLWEPRDCSTPGVPPSSVSWSLPKFLSMELMMLMLSLHLILCCPLLLLSTFPSISINWLIPPKSGSDSEILSRILTMHIIKWSLLQFKK